MMWQDLIFMVGSVFSIVSLTPTLKNAVASVPWATSLPSAAIGMVYGMTYFTLGMTLSAVGALATGVIWSLILFYRRPSSTDSDGSDQTTPA